MDSPIKNEQPKRLAVDSVAPLIFVGVADGIAIANPATFLEIHSFFNLAKVKPHFVFPAILKQSVWCFLLNTQNLHTGNQFRIRIVDSEGTEQGHIHIRADSKPAVDIPEEIKIDVLSPPPNNNSPEEASFSFIVDEGQWVWNCTRIPDLIITKPGEYRVEVESNNVLFFLGRIIFVFAPPMELTAERVGALQSDPTVPKVVGLTLGCKVCDAKLRAYTAVQKVIAQEQKGFTYYKELPDTFVCDCGKTKFGLEYLRIGMHGFLNRDAGFSVGQLSYVQQYARSQLTDISGSFLKLLRTEKKEEAIQKFLEKNKVLFARFHARKLFLKPRILGKFNADFAVLDSEGVLTFIEIERPNMRLFKSNGHLRADFNHAYEQVHDWLHEVVKHRYAVIEGLGLKQDQVLSIRGCVIAGREEVESREHLSRHMSQPRSNIDFLTFDMLANGLSRIAQEVT